VDATLYRELVANLSYLTHTRIDIFFVANLDSMFMQEPRKSHWLAAKITLYYILVHALCHPLCSEPQISLVGYTYMDWVHDVNDRKSIGDYVFYLIMIRNEAMKIQNVLFKLGFTQNSTTSLFFDNQIVIHIINNLFFHAKIK